MTEGRRAGAERLARRFLEDHPGEAAAVLEARSAGEGAACLDDAPEAVAAGVLARMAPAAAGACLEQLTPDRAAAVVERLPFGVVSAMLRRMGRGRAEALLDAMPRGAAASLRVLLHRPENTAGALMDPRVLALPADLDVADAITQVRAAAGRVIYYLYVVDRDQKLAGVLNMRELLLAPGQAPLGDVMQRPVARLSVDDTRRAVLDHPAWRVHSALPVVDEEGRFLGAIRHETVRGLERESTRTVHAAPTLETAVELGELFWVALTGAFTGFTRRWGESPTEGEGRRE